MTATAPRKALVDERTRELVAEARAMVNNERPAMSSTANLLHTVALVIALEEAEHRIRETQKDVHVAIARARMAEEDRISLQEDLRETQQLLAGFLPRDPEVHVRVIWNESVYVIERRFVREYGRFDSFQDAIRRRDEVRRSPALNELPDTTNERAIGARS